MGWSKYTEDNVEIMFERRELRKAEKQEWLQEIKNIKARTSVPHIAKSVVKGKTSESIVPVKEKYRDRTIVCKDCGEEFVFSSKVQKHYAEQKWNYPKRCKSCRDKRKVINP